ncbi:MAG TPA: saccharopine dehydrogenase C-terminal domain-containing protein, partial [Ignavibacteriaceae bacterium]|nr:saccharopine dehydrogenase C-terminal domain-containing protein [Ignavibacteriaceae bacterium]
MNKITVLGAGMVGSAIAEDLSKKYEVTVCDINEERLKELKSLIPVKIKKADISDKDQLVNTIRDSDLVVGAVPGFMGFECLKAIIESGKNVVDISFFDEDPFELDRLALENNVTAIVDCGVAPGLSNIILGYHSERMKVNSFECYVGGLPFERKPPYEYKAPFSPIDVIEEYTRPARIMVNGKVVTKEALSEPELINTEAGTLEAFNTDGLRSLLKTMKIPDMKEKTLRYPGHIQLMRALRATGFFDKEEIDIKGKTIRPVDLTSKLLFPLWKLERNEPEFTILKIRINGEGKEIEYSLFDKYDEATKTSS